MSDSKAASLHAFVHGRVQAVGFRAFVQRRCLELGLKGFVRNLSDGLSVEVMAEGQRVALESLLAALHLGPPGSHVDSVTTTWSRQTGDYSNFEAR
jgi:acylphosphatase